MSRRGKAIVIEDMQDWQELLKGYLEEVGFFVEVAKDLDTGLQKIRNENYHFATVDLQLDEATTNAPDFEGWKILDEIIKLRAESRMPTMVITGFDKEYIELSNIKKMHGTILMKKKKFEKETFLQLVTNAVDEFEVRFHNDQKDK